MKSPSETFMTPTPKPALGLNIEREHQKGLALVNPLLEKLHELKVVDEESYLVADELLGRIRQGLKQWGVVWETIQERVIKPQREALEGVYSINREIAGPLEKGEKALKASMGAYKTAEADRIARENIERDREAQRLQDEIDRATALQQQTKSPVARGVLTRNINRLNTMQQGVMETVPTPVVGAASSSRVVTYPELENLQAFAVALSVGSLKAHPIRALVIEAINAVLKGEGTKDVKAEMAQWPGCKMGRTTQIVGR